MIKNQSHTLLAIVATVFEFWECFDGTENDMTFTGVYNDLCLEIWREEGAVYHWMRKYCYWNSEESMEHHDAYVNKYNL